MNKWILTFILGWMTFFGFAQGDWTWAELNNLPISTTGNATCSSIINDKINVYSFGGLTQLTPSVLFHNRVFKYDVSSNSWEEMDTIPVENGLSGAKASNVNNRVYIIGGRHQLTDSSKGISGNVYIYNPFLDTFKINGSQLPVPVFNHVQTTWRDSLIYIISGEGALGSVPDVQIYNPYFNSWLAGTPVPNNNQFKSVGSSGYILGDTIYYFGGATGGIANHFMRKGVIDSMFPTQIDWSIVPIDAESDFYKGGSSGNWKTTFWFGGSEHYYTYDSISSTSNFPSQKIYEYNVTGNEIKVYNSVPYSVMDVSSIVKLGGGNWLVSGGIDSLQNLTNRTLLLHNPELSDIDKALHPPYFEVIEKSNHFVVITKNIGTVYVYDMTGKKMIESKKYLANLIIDKSLLHDGVLLFVYQDGINLPVTIKKINSR